MNQKSKDAAKSGITYKDAGVDTIEGARAVSLMKEHVQKTFGANVLGGLGSFGSLFKLNLDGINSPVLVAGTDGVGTKLKIAILMDKHDTVGQDLVAMCVNDVLCQGAKPLFFLDYIATGSVFAEKIAEIVKGVADGCLLARCALVGGETAEMPGFYDEGIYDIAGFAVGMVEKADIITGEKIKEGDALIGLASSGLHSNGFSLVRALVKDFTAPFTFDGKTRAIGEELLTPTRIYVKCVRALLKEMPKAVHGMAHITGGGFYENIPRIFAPDSGLHAEIKRGSWTVPPIFDELARLGAAKETLYNTFNMGVGFVLAVESDAADEVLAFLCKTYPAYKIGEVRVSQSGQTGVELL
jgi:phosphoribosylformylglycinamidine cyclo-ligase